MIKSRINESSTLALIEKVRVMREKGEDVLSFAAGEPDFPTPEPVINRAIEVLKTGQMKYVPSQGIFALRQTVSQDYVKRIGAPWVKPENVVVCAGAKQAIYLALKGILDAGDEVLIPKPYWVSYPSLVKVNGGVPVAVDTQAENSFFPTPEELDALKSERTRALMFSSPNNPTGAMISKSLLRDLIAWCQKNKVYLIYDELYEQLVLTDTAKHYCPLSFVFEKDAEYLISVNAFSKSLAMTGWRLGYIVSHRDNIKALAPLQGQILTCLPNFVQEAACIADNISETFLKPVIARYKARKEMIKAGLAEVPELEYIEPTGAFYLFVNVSKILTKLSLATDVDFCDRLLSQKKTAVTPGYSFGMPGWVRLSFAVSDDEVRRGTERIVELCQGR